MFAHKKRTVFGAVVGVFAVLLSVVLPAQQAHAAAVEVKDFHLDWDDGEEFFHKTSFDYVNNVFDTTEPFSLVVTTTRGTGSVPAHSIVFCMNAPTKTVYDFSDGLWEWTDSAQECVTNTGEVGSQQTISLDGYLDATDSLSFTSIPGYPYYTFAPSFQTASGWDTNFLAFYENEVILPTTSVSKTGQGISVEGDYLAVSWDVEYANGYDKVTFDDVISTNIEGLQPDHWNLQGSYTETIFSPYTEEVKRWSTWPSDTVWTHNPGIDEMNALGDVGTSVIYVTETKYRTETVTKYRTNTCAHSTCSFTTRDSDVRSVNSGRGVRVNGTFISTHKKTSLTAYYRLNDLPRNQKVVFTNSVTGKFYNDKAALVGSKKSSVKQTFDTSVLKVSKVSVSGSSSVAVGYSTTLKATVSPLSASNTAVSWKSSNTAIATVDSKGKVTGKKPGTVTITATAKDGSKKYASKKITVTKPVKVSKVSVSGASSVAVGKTATLKASVSPSNASNKAVSWKSSNTAVATVNANGKVTGKKAGTVTITATAKDGSGKKASIKVTVVKAEAVQVMYRLYNRVSHEHLYTADVHERDVLRRGDWNYEGVAWVAPKKSKTPVYRLYNPKLGDHHYTTDTNEVKVLTKKYGWRNEGVKWYSDDKKRVKVYRQFNPKLRVGSHNYTADLNEYKINNARNGWKGEDVAWYAIRLK